MHVFCLFFFSSFDILSNWCSAAMGGQLDRHIASLAACHCVIVIVLCYIKFVWQINSLSFSLSLCKWYNKMFAISKKNNLPEFKQISSQCTLILFLYVKRALVSTTKIFGPDEVIQVIWAKLMKRAIGYSNSWLQVVLVYLYRFRCSSLLKCALQPRIAKEILKPPILVVKVV